MTEPDALAAFASISNETRLRILKTLVTAGPDGLPAGAVAASVGASPSRASFHLSNMADAGLVTATRNAREITYRVSFDRIGALIRYLMEDCCGNDASLRACCMPGPARQGP